MTLGEVEKISTHSGVMAIILLAAHTLSAADIEGAIENSMRADAIGPLLDPVLYKRKSKALDQDRSIMLSALELVNAVNAGQTAEVSKG